MKQLNMQNDENDVIRYLMKEMDPSEEVLMERAMMEDDDLLIEVESMRQTLHRLDDLPEKAPPPELSESIVKQAGEQKSKRLYWPSVPSEFYKYAAVLLIGMGLGSGIWMYAGSGSHNRSSKNASVSGISTRDAQSAQTDTEPWTDRNNIMYYQDAFSHPASGSNGSNGILETSMDKLTPVDEHSLQINPNARGVQLTGAHN